MSAGWTANEIGFYIYLGKLIKAVFKQNYITQLSLSDWCNISHMYAWW